MRMHTCLPCLQQPADGWILASAETETETKTTKKDDAHAAAVRAARQDPGSLVPAVSTPPAFHVGLRYSFSYAITAAPFLLRVPVTNPAPTTLMVLQTPALEEARPRPAR